MPKEVRLHLQVERRRALESLWTFDDPETITIGFLPTCAVWLFDPDSGPSRVLFRRQAGRLRLRLPKNARGNLTLDGKEVSIAALRDAGLLRFDAEGEYVVLREKTAGTVRVGTTEIRFWITLAPEEPEYPLHPLPVRLARSIPKPLAAAIAVSAMLHGAGNALLARLPERYAPAIDEVDRTVARFIMPEKDSFFEKREASEERITRATEEKTEVKKMAPPPSAGGILAAATRRGPGGKRSPFESLFTAAPIAGDLDQVLKGESLEAYISKQLKKGVAIDLTAAPRAMEIRAPESGSRQVAQLEKNTEGPTVARLSMDAPEVEGRVDREVLSKIVIQNVGQLRDCYERGLARKPDLAGKLVLSLVIDLQGRPTGVAVDESTLRDATVERCIVARISSWTFPSPRGGATPVRFPFIFSAASRG